jgi:hypothetical protein
LYNLLKAGENGQMRSQKFESAPEGVAGEQPERS